MAKIAENCDHNIDPRQVNSVVDQKVFFCWRPLVGCFDERTYVGYLMDETRRKAGLTPDEQEPML
jgi:hypothetical protein